MAERETMKPEQKSEKAPEIIKGALVLRPETVRKILGIFDEMPRRYSTMIDPVINEMMGSPIADITVTEKEEKK